MASTYRTTNVAPAAATASTTRPGATASTVPDTANSAVRSAIARRGTASGPPATGGASDAGRAPLVAAVAIRRETPHTQATALSVMAPTAMAATVPTTSARGSTVSA